MSDTRTPLADLANPSWPPLTCAPGQLRARARRRRMGRVTLGAVAAAGVLITAATHLPDSSTAAQQANRPQLTGGRWHAYGTTLILPDQWTMTPARSTPGTLNACLDPVTSPSRCALQLSVVEDPKTAHSSGISPEKEVTVGCQDTSPTLTLEAVTVNGRTGKQWHSQCTAPAGQHLLWALDNRTVALRVQDARYTGEAQAIFANLRVPASWPTTGIEYQTASSAPIQSPSSGR